MLKKFETYFKTEFPEPEKYDFYLAISGGKDSMALSHLLINSGIKHNLLHCNFKLRGIESDEDETFVKAHGKKHDLTVLMKSFNTHEESKKAKTNTQLTARNLRYNWFNEIIGKKKNRILLTAHHLDDSIETFFINLMRGTGIKGLSGIPKRSDQIFRPLLAFTLPNVVEFIENFNIEYRQDESNFEDKYLRNKIRQTIIPLIEDLSPEFRKKFSALFGEQEKLSSFIEVEKNKKIKSKIIDTPSYSYLPISIFEECDEFLMMDYLKSFGVSRSKYKEFKKFLKSKKGSFFRTDTNEFLHNETEILCRINRIKPQPFNETINLDDLPKKVDAFSLSILNNSKLTFFDPLRHFLALEKIKWPITIRNWTEADKIQPFGMKGSKLLSDVLIDKKINRFIKEDIFLLIDSSDHVIAIPGIMISERMRVEMNSNEVLSISSSF